MRGSELASASCPQEPWRPIETAPESVVVETKIDDAHGVRNVQKLYRDGEAVRDKLERIITMREEGDCKTIVEAEMKTLAQEALAALSSPATPEPRPAPQRAIEHGLVDNPPMIRWTELSGGASETAAGWKLVPVEPTRAMKDAVSRKVDDFARESVRLFVTDIWSEMIAVSPPTPAATPEPALAGGEAYAIKALMKAVQRAEDGAGTIPAKEAVKLRPSDWHAVCDRARKLAALSPAPAPDQKEMGE